MRSNEWHSLKLRSNRRMFSSLPSLTTKKAHWPSITKTSNAEFLSFLSWTSCWAKVELVIWDAMTVLMWHQYDNEFPWSLYNHDVSNRKPAGLVGTRKLHWGARPVPGMSQTWWRHQMETFSALLALCEGNSSVTGEFPSQRPVTRSFDVFLWSASE